MPAVTDISVGGNVLSTTDPIEKASAPKIPGLKTANALVEYS